MLSTSKSLEDRPSVHAPRMNGMGNVFKLQTVLLKSNSVNRNELRRKESTLAKSISFHGDYVDSLAMAHEVLMTLLDHM